jgi:cob(I)alamin adenosyltransferase
LESKVTTRRGDRGATNTLGGEKLAKHHPAIEATGRLDSMRATLALLRHDIEEEAPAERAFLLWVLHACFFIGSAVNDAKNRHPERHPRKLSAAHLEKLEAHAAAIENKLQLPDAFIVCAATPAAARADAAAAAVRAFERSLSALAETEPAFDTAILMPFINRLSDYLYLLARRLENGAHQTVDYTILDSD